MKNPLLDMEFLNELHNHRQRETYARITLLTQNELPIEYIEGRITAGSVSVDGNSALRRTCNLTLTLQDQIEINEFYWTFQSKFKLEVGLKNMINTDYPDIIWFPQGIFILTSCNMNQTTNNYTITINGKDKMCKLNGDMGGNIMASTDFGVLEEVDKEGNITYTKLLLKDIIREMLTNQGGELPENIIINDLDEAGLELLEYRCEEKPLYLFRRVDNDSVDNVTLNEEMKIRVVGATENISVGELNSYREMDGLILDNEEATKIYLLDQNYEPINIEYQVMKYKYGDLAGYRLTDLTYAGDLKSNVGETIVSVLDKIKNMLGEFEYFYNLDGRFVFQKKRTYISTPWNAVEANEEDFISEAIKDSYPMINLTDAKLTTAFANNPNLLNLKNDFSVWGTYKSMSGADVPIHMRYVIDKKPVQYQPIRPLQQKIEYYTNNSKTEEEIKSFDAFSYGDLIMDNEPHSIEWTIGENKYREDTYSFYAAFPYKANECDWRELIYQMALDYYKCHTDEDFRERMIAANPWTAPNGRTGYEQYYTDLQGYWRQLYDPNPDSVFEEIDADYVTAEQNNGKQIYVDMPYLPLTDEEKSLLLTTDDKLNTEAPIGIDDLYIIKNIDIKDANGNTFTKSTFYPFIGSSDCCLEENQTYYYEKKSQLTSTSDTITLNAVPLKAIYKKLENNTFKLVVEVCLKAVLADPSIIFWRKASKKMPLTDIDARCLSIYRGEKINSKDTNPNYIQYLTNWYISDNYGTLSNKRETMDRITYLIENVNGDYGVDHWNKTVKEAPDQLTFWFDFLDAEGSELFDKYSVKSVGDRTKSINDNNVKSIYYRDVPNIIFTKGIADKSYERQSGYTYIYVSPAYQSLFNISGRGKSAKERIDELLQQHSYCIEATNITTVPLYHLEPNTRVFVRDDKTNVHGEYMVNKVTVPFAYSGTMSLSANKIVSNII